MSAQNRYRASFNYKRSETEGWLGWRDSHYGAEYSYPADSWRDAILEWLDRAWPAGDYTVVAETPSEDGRSGIIEIQHDPSSVFAGEVEKIKATLLIEA